VAAGGIVRAAEIEKSRPYREANMNRCIGRIGCAAVITLFIGAAAAIAQPFTAFQISNDAQDSRFVSTDGRYVVWTSIGAQLNVLGYDLQTGQPLTLAAGGAAPDIDKGILVKELGASLQGQNVVTGAQFPVNNTGSRPRISGNLVVWDQLGTTNEEVFGRRLDQPGSLAFPISGSKSYDQFDASADGNLVVWGSINEPSDPGNIYGRDLSSSTVFPITTNSARQLNPRLSGHYVVWEDMRDAVSRIYAKDLTGGIEFPLSSATFAAEMPAIDGDLVVWRQFGPGNSQTDIWGRLLSGGPAFQITNTATIWESQPDVRGNLVVWEQGLSGSDNDIWGTVVPEPAGMLTMLMGLAMLARRAGRRQ
jgi:beta propeller repeat protein